jgi:hypothetical protein
VQPEPRRHRFEPGEGARVDDGGQEHAEWLFGGRLGPHSTEVVAARRDEHVDDKRRVDRKVWPAPPRKIVDCARVLEVGEPWIVAKFIPAYITANTRV